jgi:endonuclease YncB( thermonuclease family)
MKRLAAALRFLVCAATQAFAGAGVVILQSQPYRLEGIDAPELDQTCLDELGKSYACGQAAADAVTAFIAGRPVYCTDRGADPQNGNRRMGQCYVDGIDINRWLVKDGWAVDLEPNGRFKVEEELAEATRAGVWKGCFVAPEDFREWREEAAALLGFRCLAGAREAVFPDEAPQPDGFAVKGHYALRAWPYQGIYHAQNCGSYRRTKAKRWFRTEADAIAASFRRSHTCGWW